MYLNICFGLPACQRHDDDDYIRNVDYQVPCNKESFVFAVLQSSHLLPPRHPRFVIHVLVIYPHDNCKMIPDAVSTYVYIHNLYYCCFCPFITVFIRRYIVFMYKYQTRDHNDI